MAEFQGKMYRHETAQTDTAVTYDGLHVAGDAGIINFKVTGGDNAVSWYFNKGESLPADVSEIVSASTTATDIVGFWTK